MQGKTVLMYACMQDRPKVVQMLLSRGADVATVSNEVLITAVTAATVYCIAGRWCLCMITV